MSVVDVLRPVRIQAVHSSMFHRRQQGQSETVDHYVQELRKLFYKAYPQAGQDNGEAKGFGRAVLAYRFGAGVTTVLRKKVAGIEELLNTYWSRPDSNKLKKRLGFFTKWGTPTHPNRC